MVLRDVRLAPSSLRRALLLLVPLALLGSALLGLLAQSASAGHDDAPPPPPQLVGPASPDDSTTPSWTFTTPAGTTSTSGTVVDGATTTVTIAHEYDTQCVYGTSATPDSGFSATTPSCTSPYTGAVDGDGTYVLSLRTAETTTTTTTTDDGSGPTPVGTTVETAYSAAESAAYVHDATAPVVDVTAPTPGAYDGWTVGVTDPGAVTLACTLGKEGGTAGPVDCAVGTVAPPLVEDGTYVLTVTASDAAGNQAAPVSSSYAFVGSPPVVTVDGPATGSSTTPTFSVSLTSLSPVTVTCSVSSSGTAVCGSTSVTVALGVDGSYTVTVTARDEQGRTGSGTHTYVLDTTAPTVAVTAPADTGNDTTPLWGIGGEGYGTADCVLTHTTTGAVVESRACGSLTSHTSAELAATDGTSYTLTVTVTDAAGNTATASDTYLLDTTAPTVSLAPGAGTGSDLTPSWTIGGAGSTSATCVLTRAGDVVESGPCDSLSAHKSGPLPSPTSGTTYLLTVTVTDDAGNVASTTATYVLDTVAELAVTDPRSPGNDTTPTWTFAPETGATVRCELVGPAGAVPGGTCDSGGFTAAPLPDTAGADYVLTVTVTDPLGNVTVHTRPVHRLDTRLPGAAVTVPPSPSRETSVTWTVVTDEPVSSATCALRRDGVVVLSLTSCAGSSTVALPGDGRYDLVVTLVDLAGNTSTTTSGVLVHDATVPTAPLVTPGSTTTNATTATWTVTAEAGTATTCRLSRGGTVLVDWTSCNGTYSAALPGDGSYLLEVVSTDAVGPGPVTSAAYLLDTVPSAAPRVTGPAGPSQSRTPSWTVEAEAGTSTECRLVRGSTTGSTTGGTVVNEWGPCTGGFVADLTALPDGGYVLESRATDAAGNVSAVGSSAPYVLDTTGPVAPVVRGPSGPSQSRTPGFTWTSETGARAECRLSHDGAVVGEWTSCASPYAPSLTRDGTWTLSVRLVDPAGNVSDTGTSGGYVLDTTAPATPVVTPPSTPGRDLAPSWGAVVEGGAALECRLTGADGVVAMWSPCAVPLVTSLTGRPDGAYVLEVRATDAAGNLSAVGSGTYLLDTVAPAAAVVVPPAGPGRTRAPAVSFTTEAGATTRCRLTSGATLLSEYAPCTSPTTLDLTGLPDGTYTLTVRVTDAAGNPGPSATGTYVLDTTAPPAPVLTLTPASPSPSRTLAYDVSHESGSTLVCRLTFPTGAVREIASSVAPFCVDLAGLPDGSYTLTVRAVDAAGNVGTATADVHVLDSTSPAPPQVTGPTTAGSDRTPTWTLSATVGTTECRLVRGTTVVRDWAACTGTHTADLYGQPDGAYTLQVRARDAAGALSAPTGSRYVLDTTPPSPATLVAPPTPSTNRLPTWSIASAETGATAQCRVLVFGSVLRDWVPCAVSVAGSLHTVDLTGLGDGTYTLVVRLTDAAGNVGTTTATSDVVLDTSAPVAVGVTGPPSPGNDRDPTWLLATGSGTELECRLTSAAGVVSDWATCAGEYTADLTDLPDGTYTLAVRAVSAAGTPGPETTSAYVLSTVGPAAPTAVALPGRSPSNDRSPTWTFTLPSGTTGACRVVQGTREVFAGACTSPFTLDLSSAVDGTYTLTVTAVDAAGNRTAAAPSTYVLDTEPTQQPVLTQVPGATGSTLSPQWRFTVARGATAQCRLLHEGVALDDWATCSSPYTASLTGRPDGSYVLQVRAVDAAGNTSAPVSDAYLLDRAAPPVVTFTATPATPDADRVVRWGLAAPDGSTLECRVAAPDGTATAWGRCGTASGALRTTGSTAATTAVHTVDLAGRPDGEYALEVRVVTADGVVGSVGRATYRLDTVPPAAPVFSDVPPAAGNSPAPTWLWEAGGDVLVECRLVRSGGSAVERWSECADGQYVADLTRLGQGSYALEIRVTDQAGNASPVTRAAYRYDTTAPAAPTFTSRPPASGGDRTVSWTFAVPPDTTATCTVTRDVSVVRRESACSGRYDLDLSGLADGSYTLTVRYTDAAGNVSPATSGTYLLASLRAGGPVRVEPPQPGDPFLPAPGSGTTTPPGPGRTGTGTGTAAPAPGRSTSAPRVPTIPVDDDVVRSSDSRSRSSALDAAPARQDAAPRTPDPEPSGGSNPLLPKDFVDAPVPDVIKDVAIGTIKRPTLPLALLAIVVLFLLAQNRIDRRDPKLAAAPVEAEPELDFSPYSPRQEGAQQ